MTNGPEDTANSRPSSNKKGTGAFKRYFFWETLNYCMKTDMLLPSSKNIFLFIKYNTRNVCNYIEIEISSRWSSSMSDQLKINY